MRVTRAKTASLGTDVLSAGISKKPLQAKKSTTSSNVPTVRKRAALVDVSNLAKNEAADTKNVKKSRATLVSKTVHNAGVQKPSRTASTRSVLGTKDENKKAAAADLKRPASGSGIMGGAQKKRQTGSTASQRLSKSNTPASENEVPKTNHFAVEVQQRVQVEKTEVIKLEPAQPAQPEARTAQQTLEEAIQDLDAEDSEDPLMVAEYVHDIFDYLKVLERTTLPNPDYMEHQDDLDWHERNVLIDWLIEVHQKFSLLPETLFLAINILDRFLSHKIAQLAKLQLVGVTAMFIAAKYEEVLSPHVANFAYVTDTQCSEADILSAERYILATLDYDLSYPNPMNFLRRISKADNYDIQTRTLGKYLLEIGVVDHKFMAHRPSLIAAASMYMSRMILGRGEWVSCLHIFIFYLSR